MRKSYIPKATEQEFCSDIQLCTVRKWTDGMSKIGVKDLQGNIHEEPLEDIMNSDTYKGKKLFEYIHLGIYFWVKIIRRCFLLRQRRKEKFSINSQEEVLSKR